MRATSWRAVGVGLVVVATWLIGYGLPAHAPPTSARGELMDSIIAGTMGETRGLHVPHALYLPGYLVAVALLAFGIERMVRAGGLGRRVHVSCPSCDARSARGTLSGRRCVRGHRVHESMWPLGALIGALLACAAAVVVWPPS